MTERTKIDNLITKLFAQIKKINLTTEEKNSSVEALRQLILGDGKTEPTLSTTSEAFSPLTNKDLDLDPDSSLR